MADPLPCIMEIARPANDLVKALVSVDRNRALLDRAETVVYREDAGRGLKAYVFRPPGWSPRDMRPALLFFHGSLWEKGLVSQFAPQALSFAERGMVTILFEYRLNAKDGTHALDALDDVAAAHFWVAGHAGALGVDPGRIVMCGASAGAWMAMVRSLHLLGQKPEDREQSPPAALILLEPVVEVVSKSPWSARFPDVKAIKRMLPLNALRKGAPPALFMHGSQDPVVPFGPGKKLAKAWRGKNSASEFVPYEGAGHGFYNFNVDVRLYENTLNVMDAFLVKLGFLEPGDLVVAL